MQNFLQIGIQHYVALGILLFFIGLLGVMIRKNALIVLTSMELMFLGAIVVLAAFSKEIGNELGQLIALFGLLVATAYAAFGLAILVALRRNKPTVYIQDVNDLKH